MADDGGGGGLPPLPKRWESQLEGVDAVWPHTSVGSLPAMKYSCTLCGQEEFASWPDFGSIISAITPGGGSKSAVFLYCGRATARFMNSAQMGAADALPERPRSRLSSKPTHTTQSRFEVNPANQPSREVPVLPAASAVKPMERTLTPVPRLMTSSMMLVVRKATRGSSTARVRGAAVSSTVPSAASTLRRKSGSARKPLVANGV